MKYINYLKCTLLLLLIGVLTTNFKCSKNFDYDNSSYLLKHMFKVPINIYPLKKIYTLKDTIWLETDIHGKMLYDTISKQMVFADSGKIALSATLNRFGSDVTDPKGGFCDFITVRGVNVDRDLGMWSTTGRLYDVGCDDTTYKCKIGFKPLVKGPYYLTLYNHELLENCSDKREPHYSAIIYGYNTANLGLEILNTFPTTNKSGLSFIANMVRKKETFVFRVE